MSAELGGCATAAVPTPPPALLLHEEAADALAHCAEILAASDPKRSHELRARSASILKLAQVVEQHGCALIRSSLIRLWKPPPTSQADASVLCLRAPTGLMAAVTTLRNRTQMEPCNQPRRTTPANPGRSAQMSQAVASTAVLTSNLSSRR